MLSEIKDFKDLHSSKRCFILASGPSLKDLNLEPLNRRITIGLNRSFLAFERATYHCVFDYRLYELYEKELQNSRYLFTLEDRPFGIPLTLLGTNGFSWDLEEGIYSGYTISYFALQLAAYMGFKEIFFLGLDLNNTEKETHFFGHDYSSNNHNNTEYPKMMKSFEKISETLKVRGIKVYNCSSKSKLKCFPFMSYKDAIKL
ncbi:MAG: hypothetical protein VX341_07375 [Bdellovibrionota bacterium]|nr:hypothetical protein [Bdellovibrionota bacterium]